MADYETSHHAIVGVDLESYSKRTDREQVAAQNALEKMLERGLGEAYPQRIDYATVDTGDGAFLCLPDHYEKTRLITTFVPAVTQFLLKYNDDKSDDAKMRVRMVLHAGNVSIHGNTGQPKFAGKALNHTARLLNAAFLRRALKNASARHPLVFAVSEPFYEDVVLGHLSEYRNDFKRHQATVKGTSLIGWLHVEGAAAPESAAHARPHGVPAKRSGSKRPARSPSGAARSRKTNTTQSRQARDSYPLLWNDVTQAGTLLLPGQGGKGGYEFRLFSVGERGTGLEPALVIEVESGLLEKIKSFDEPFDYILAVEQAGVRWALLVARQLGQPLKIITLQPSDPNPADQVSERQRKGGLYKQRELYFPRMKSQTRVLVVDDVISSGATIRAILRGLKKCKVEAIGILCIIDKTGASREIEAEQGIPVKSLITIV